LSRIAIDRFAAVTASARVSTAGAAGPLQSKLINDGPQKTYVLVLENGDEAVSSIESFARDIDISAAQLTGIGAFSDAVLVFEWETKHYRKIPVNEQVEVVSLLGDVALGPDGKPALHPTSWSAVSMAWPWAAPYLKRMSGRPSR
jgi:hypothetical protein